MASEKPRFVNAGSYGCVYKPSLPCELRASHDKNTIGKLMVSEDDVREEWDANKVIKLIDPDNQFTVKAHGVCRDYEMSKVDRDEIASCTLIEDQRATKTSQIVYDYGGTTITSFLGQFGESSMPVDTFVRLFFKFGNLFFGAMKLAENKRIHFDIKSENVLIDDDMNLRLIDFGLLTTHEDIGSNDLISYAYRYFPPELRVYANMTDDNGKNVDVTPTDVLNEYNVDAGYTFIETCRLFDPVADVNAIFRTPKADLLTFARRRVDVFALGWLLCLVGFSADNMSAFPPEVKFPILSFIRGTARFHPEHRMSPEDAYAYHNFACSFLANSSALHTATVKSLPALRPGHRATHKTKSKKQPELIINHS